MPAELDDLQRQVEKLSRKIAAFTLITDRARDEVRAGSGTDETTAVTVQVGADGTPTSIELADGWRSRIPTGALSKAIVSACHAAHQAQTTSFLAIVDAAPASLDDIPVPMADHHRQSARQSADLAQLEQPPDRGSIAQAITALDQAVATPATPDLPRDVEPVATSEHPVVFGFRPDGTLTGCSIDPHWERRYPTSRMADELTATLRDQLTKRG